MKANELRIGNWVDALTGDVQVVTISKDKISTDRFYYNMDFIEPINLTSEWLERFGFKNWGDKYTFGLDGFNIHKRKRGFVLRKSVPIVKYVHQLQNLYFAMTGKELEYRAE